MPIVFSLFLALSLLLASPASAARLNLGLLQTQANDDADLTLSEVPRNMTAPSDRITIRWSPENIRGTLRFAADFSGDTPDGYEESVDNPVESIGGSLTIRGDQLPVGYLYCIIDAGDDGYSVVFNLIRISGTAPRMVAPITGAGREGINTVTPAFRWEPVGGVPFYHIVVSDQPFTITEDENGTRVEGSNIVWQAITSQTSIQFGVPDPAEFFDNDQIAPLVGSMDRDDRPRYSWVVLNNYGNHPGYSSTVTGGVAGFEVEMEPPFDEPENISPRTQTSINTREIVFRWTQVEEAVSYFIYVSREEVTPGGSRALVPAWNAQTTFTTIACPSAEVLSSGRYVWKVLAASRQGRGTLSDTSSFTYNIRSGTIEVHTTTIGDSPLEFVEVQTEPVNGPAIPGFSTDDAGYHTRNVPVGTYIFRAIKEGYADTLSSVINIRQGETSGFVLRLRPIPSSIVGTTIDDEGRAVSGAIVSAVRVPGGAETLSESNISGAYQLVVAPGNYLVSAHADGREPAEEYSVAVGRGENIDLDAAENPFELAAYRYNLSGYVRNSNGQPINSATLILTSEQGQETRAYTPEAGTYAFDVGVGIWHLNAVKPGFYLESGEVEFAVRDRDQEINFTLVPQAGIFSGQVMMDGAPANRNADVWFIPSAGAVTTAQVNHIGAFSRGVSPGDYVAVAVREGYHTEDSLQLSVGPAETISGLRLVLEANPSSISGHITDAGGNNLRDAVVQAGGVNTNSDANGSYTLRVAAGTHTIIARKNGFVTGHRGPISVQAGQNLQNIDLQLVDNAGAISGRVRRGNDAIYDAVVTATRQGGNRASQTTRTDRDGRYTFGIAFGDYRLTVEREGFIAADPGIIDVQLQPGQVVSGRDFAMLNYSGRLAGNVSSPAGAINTPTIRIAQLDDPNRTYTTNGNVQGDYVLTIAPEHRYIVTASKIGFSTATDTTENLEVEGELVVNFRLTPLPCIISGTVTVADQPLSGATIRADGQAGSFQAVSDRAGNYGISLQPGQYRLTASRPGYTVVEQDQRLNAGENIEDFDFALQTNFGLVAGFVRDPDNAGIAGAEVTVIDSINQRSRTAQSDRDGAYLLEGIIPGNYHLICTSQRYRRQTQNLGAVLGRQERRGVNLEMTPLSARLTGRVTSGGNPVASATVYANEAGGGQFTALTNDNGVYTIGNMSDGVFVVRPAKNGYTGVVRPGIELQPADTLAVDLALILNNGRISGVVRDPDGVGLRNVTVSAVDSLGNFAAASTNAAGQFSLDNLFQITLYRVSAVLNGYTAQQDTVRNVANGAELAIRLIPNELRLSGRVQNQVGQGLAGTNLTATSLADGSVYTTTADQAGNYTITGLAANTRYRLQTQRIEESYANADTTVQVGNNHLAGAPARIIQRSAIVRGRVTTSDNQGVGDVLVNSRNLITGRQRTVYTSNDGSFRILGMRGGDLDDYVIRISKQGYSVRQPDSIRVEGLGITEERVGVNFVADEVVVSIAGVVTDSLGVPFSDVPVIAWSEAGFFRDTTDGNGAFTFEQVFPNQNYSLSTELPRESYENSSASVNVAQSNVSGIRLSVSRHNATITGITTAQQGAPLVGVTVILDQVSQTASDLNGRYTFAFVSPGLHNLTFSKTGYASQDHQINAENGEGSYTRDVSLVALDRAVFGNFNSRIDQTPVPGIVVRLNSETGDTLFDTTNTDGAFQFNRLDPLRTYQLFSSRKGWESNVRAGISIAAGNVEIISEISPPASGIYGRLLSADGMPVIGGEVRLRSFEDELLTNIADHYGDYLLPVASGTWSIIGLAVAPYSGTTRSRNVQIVSGQSTRLDLSLESTSRATGRLRLDDGSVPLTRGRVTASHDATGDVYFDVAGDNGEFVVEGLRPGAYTLLADVAGYAMEVSPYRFEAMLDQTADMTITMTRSGKAITGYVLNPDGVGVVGARVTVTGNSSGSLETDGRGYWALLGPEAGQYTLSITRNGYISPIDTTFEMIAGDIAQINRTIIPSPLMISGKVLNPFNRPHENAAVIFSGPAGFADTLLTARSGEYALAGLLAGEYTFQAAVPGYSSVPAQKQVVLEGIGYALDQDFALVAIQGIATVYGVISHRTDILSNVEIEVADLQSGRKYHAVSDGNGRYRIEQIPTPSTVRVSAFLPDVPVAQSNSFQLDADQELEIDIAFPAGQIRVQLLNSEGAPIVGRRVFISGITQNYNSILFSDATGHAETPDLMPAGEYSVTPEALAGMLPPSPEVIELGENEVRNLTWYLGWKFTPPPPFSFEDSARVEIAVPGAVSVSEAKLFVKGPGAATFTSSPLVRQGGGMPGRVLRGVTSETPQIFEADATVVYYGYIPPQERSGTLTFYLQVSTSDGYLFGGPETAQNVTVNARGRLDRVELIRSQAALTPRLGVPIRLEAVGFDDGNNDLTERLRTEGTFAWSQIGEEHGRLEIDPADSSIAIYYPESAGNAEVKGIVQQPRHGVVVSRSLQWQNVEAVVSAMRVAAPALAIEAGDSIRFTITATDSLGSLVPIAPVWNATPPSAATIQPVAFSMDAWLASLPGRIGRVQVTATDSLSDMSDSFNDDSPDRSQRGISIYGEVTARADTLTFNDGLGFELKIPPNSVGQNAVARVFLSEPVLTPVFRLTPKYELPPLGYSLKVEGSMNQSSAYSLILPAQPGFAQHLPTVGVWNPDRIDWDVKTGSFNDDSSAVVVQISQLDGLYALISASDALGVNNLKFVPNPFSPSATVSSGQKGLSIEFLLSSNVADRPIFTVKIYNMQGQLVKSLRDHELVPKGDYRRGGENSLIWDGLTDDGTMARNGRYMIVVIAEDASGEAKEVGSAVLVK